MKLICFSLRYNNCKYYLIMPSKPNSNITSASNRKPPTCTRCRNHGIYDVQLKGHRNLCQYKLCNCKHCSLIVQRRLVVVKPDRPQTDARGKSSRKKQPVKKLEEMDGMEKNVAEALIEPRMGESLPPSFPQGKGHAGSMFTSLTPFNPREFSNVKNGHANIPKEQPRLFPDCTNFTGPPHPYGCLGCYSPRIQNFNPGAPPNITVGSPSLPRMMVPLPEQPNVFLNFPATCHQGFAVNSSPLNLNVQRPVEPYQKRITVNHQEMMAKPKYF